MAQPPEKKQRTGSMPPEMKMEIEQALEQLGEVDRYRRPHRKGAGPVQAKILPPEDLVHDKTETIRQGSANRIHYKCSNEKCKETIRADRWETHVINARSDRHLQEPAEDVLDRSMNFAPGPDWDDVESRQQRVVTFMEQRHYLTLARQHGEVELAKKLTTQNAFHIRITNMVRSLDPTSKTFLAHYARHYKDPGSLADLLLNVMVLRNTMSKEMVKLCELGKIPWLTLESGNVSQKSKKDIDEIFLRLSGKVFFVSVEPQKSRSKAPRRGWSELVAEIISFAKKANVLAELWRGDDPINRVSKAIRKIPGFGGKACGGQVTPP